VQWEGLGSATAFTGLFDGSADIGASSRTVTPEELARAKDLGIALKEYVLGYDGIAIIVNPANPVRQLTIAQLSSLLSGGVSSWKELGGNDEKPSLYGRPTYSGTHAFVREKVVRRGDKASTAGFAASTVAYEHSAELVDAVSKNRAGVAYVGMGWVRPGVLALAVAKEAGAPFVTASAESVRTGAYPISRPLLLYTRGEPQGDVRRLLQFAIAGEGRKLVASHDFIPPDVSAIVQRAPPVAPAASVNAAPRSILHVAFASGSSLVSPREHERLAPLAKEALRTRARILLTGNTDSSGDAAANGRLARERVRAVARALGQLGLHWDHLRFEYRGADAPLATNETSGGRRENRRVDVELLRAK
jgi:ABC-type phosphate transport system substrate-binding protein